MPNVDNAPIHQPHGDQAAKEAEEYLLILGRISMGFARVRRRPRYPDGENESDVEHSYLLGLAAAELAAAYFPELDVGLISQFALVHDLPEFYAGDTPTLAITEAARSDKELAEKEALARLFKELPPHTAKLLERYEQQEEPEARFVRLVDKLMPALTITIAGFNDEINQEYGITSSSQLQKIRADEAARLQKLFPEFPFLHVLRESIVISIDKQ